MSDASGGFASPNFPGNYAAGLSCLWVIKPTIKDGSDVKTIRLRFDDQYDVRRLPSCDDYLVTSYPGIREPIVECGKDVLDKTVEAGQVWIEFVSNGDSDVGKGFKLTYESFDVLLTTTSAPVVQTTTTSEYLFLYVFIIRDYIYVFYKKFT